jgi:hypothetical protein
MQPGMTQVGCVEFGERLCTEMAAPRNTQRIDRSA